MDTDAESVSTVPDSKPLALVASDEVANNKGPRAFLNEPIPESPRQPPEKAEENKDEKLGAVTDKPSHNPDKIMDEEESDATLLPGDPLEKSPTEEKQAIPTSLPANGKAKAEKPKEKPAPAPTKTAAVKKTAPRPTTTSTKPAATTKPAAKSPATTKAPATTTHKTEAKPATKAHERLAVKKEPSTTTKSSAPATKPITSTASKKPQPLKPSTTDTGFVKPKPKSPTKPAHLPASLTAPTASSVSKSGAARQSTSRQSNTALNVPGRSPSRASAGTATSTTKTVKRQTSNLKSSRPSLGPPPKKSSQDQSGPKKEAHVDESFLARMMRPTQSSANKTTEKAPTTPPRRTAKRPSTGTEHPPRKEISMKSLGPAKKSEPARKHADSATSSHTADSEEATAEPAVEAVSDPVQESVKVEDKSQDEATVSEHSQPAVEESKEAKEPETVPEPTVEEVAIEAANVETAEEAIELAKEVDLVEEEAAPKVEEPLSTTKKDEPASLEQLKSEIAETKAEEPSFDESDEEEEATENKKPEPVTAPQEKSTLKETGSEEPKDTVTAKVEPVAVNVETPVESVEPVEEKKKTEVVEEKKTEVAEEKKTEPVVEKTETVNEDDAPKANGEKEAEKIVDETPIEDIKQDTETASKEATAAN